MTRGQSSHVTCLVTSSQLTKSTDSYRYLIAIASGQDLRFSASQYPAVSCLTSVLTCQTPVMTSMTVGPHSLTSHIIVLCEVANILLKKTSIASWSQKATRLQRSQVDPHHTAAAPSFHAPRIPNVNYPFGDPDGPRPSSELLIGWCMKSWAGGKATLAITRGEQE